MNFLGLFITTNNRLCRTVAELTQRNYNLGFESGRHYEKRMSRTIVSKLLEDNHKLQYGTPVPERDIPAEKTAAAAMKG